MKIIIVGAGIGGLTAAAVLAGQGHEIQVLEQTPEPKPVGAGISLQPNAMQALATLGLDGLIAQRGWATSIARISFSDGRLVREMDFSGYSDRYHFLPHAIHRAELFDILYQAASDAGATIRFGASFESFSQSAAAYVFAHVSRVTMRMRSSAPTAFIRVFELGCLANSQRATPVTFAGEELCRNRPPWPLSIR